MGWVTWVIDGLGLCTLLFVWVAWKRSDNKKKQGVLIFGMIEQGRHKDGVEFSRVMGGIKAVSAVISSQWNISFSKSGRRRKSRSGVVESLSKTSLDVLQSRWMQEISRSR